MKLQSVKERSGLSLITKPKRVKARLWYLYKQNHDPEFRDRLFEIYRLHAEKIQIINYTNDHPTVWSGRT